MSTTDLMNSVLDRLDAPRREAFGRLISRYPELAERITHLISEHDQRLGYDREVSCVPVRRVRSRPASHVSQDGFPATRTDLTDDPPFPGLC